MSCLHDFICGGGKMLQMMCNSYGIVREANNG
jgi:hypothetical protein